MLFISGISACKTLPKDRPMPLIAETGASIYSYIAQNTVYPQKALEEGIHGVVHIGFTVTKIGTVENIVIIKSAHKILDEAAQNVIRNIPHCLPAVENGVPQDTTFSIPIRFMKSY
ncbi:energy transducer TonB [Treponema sp. OMZ 840]|uniref:energy transducer TonB n=1 Tax=Treponema sp. OMZ 840 TaxID=244313 RepID=UPI003D8A7FD4